MDSKNTTIVCIDVQEKLVNMLQNKDQIARNCEKMMKIASVLDLDTIITEQYPKGLGATIEAIKNIKNFKTIEKTTFSALQTPEFEQEFNKFENKNVIIFGIETHICVYQTVEDLIKKGFNVYVVCDCCASRSELNYEKSLKLMENLSAKITTLEIVLFELLKSSKHPCFKELQSLIK